MLFLSFLGGAIYVVFHSYRWVCLTRILTISIFWAVIVFQMWTSVPSVLSIRATSEEAASTPWAATDALQVARTVRVRARIDVQTLICSGRSACWVGEGGDGVWGWCKDKNSMIDKYALVWGDRHTPLNTRKYLDLARTQMTINSSETLDKFCSR